MLSPLVTNTPALPDGPSPEAAEILASSRESGRFAQLLTSCLKNSKVCGESLPAHAFLKKGSSESSFSSFALLAFLQGAVKDPLNTERKETGEEASGEGVLCPPTGAALSAPLFLPEETSGFPIISEISSGVSSEPGEKEASCILLPPAERPGAEESPDEEESMTPGGLLLADSVPFSEKESAGEEDLPSFQKAQVRIETVALLSGPAPAPAAVPEKEIISASGKTLPEAGEVSSGKKASGDAARRTPLLKEEISVPPREHADQEKDGEAASSPRTGKGKDPAATDPENGSADLSSSGEEEEKPSLSEKEFPILKNPAQDNTRKTHELLSEARDGQKEPQPAFFRNGDSSFPGILRAAGTAETKGTSGVSRGTEVPLSTRNGEALGEGMTNVVRFLKRDGLHRATIVVEPPALGRVEIELSSTAGGVEASIRVGNEQLRQLVQDQLIVLRNALSQQGVQMASCTVDIGGGGKGQGSEKEAGEGKKAHAGRSESDPGEEMLSFRVDLEQGLLYWMA